MNNKINPQVKSRVRQAWVVLGAICILVALNILTLVIWRGATAINCDGTKIFINQRFACGHKDIISKKEYSKLKFDINAYIEEKKQEGKITNIGIWFRDLDAGPTFGINEREDFVPASLLKLPLAMTFLELAENNPELLNKKIVYGNTVLGPSQIFVPNDPIQKGRTYTIDELITHTIVNSDNNAAQILYEYILKNYPGSLEETYRNLGIIDPGTSITVAAVNTKEYGAIFRMLYNISFLNVDMSEKLLGLLVQTDFKQGLTQGIPKGVQLANKFGERSLLNGEKQLHDCGIIYYPRNPYQLCVMTRGADYADLQKVIGDISRMIYEEVDNRRISSSPQNVEFGSKSSENAVLTFARSVQRWASDISARNLIRFGVQNDTFQDSTLEIALQSKNRIKYE